MCYCDGGLEALNHKERVAVGLLCLCVELCKRRVRKKVQPERAVSHQLGFPILPGAKIG
jgi:hypothetical protein